MSNGGTGRKGFGMGFDPWRMFSSITPLDDDYERPNMAYRCGRERRWAKPCPNGPTVGGKCGGTSECAPHLKDGRYECRLPKWAGGPCADGPMPDGTCCRTHPPCVPNLTTRAVRNRLSIVAAAAAVALIGAFLSFAPDSAAWFSSLDPGPLSGAHAEFTEKQGCAACHEAHSLDAGAWFLAAFTPSDPTAKCLSCHSFAGPERAAHNATFARAEATGAALGCTSCHTEHKGAMAQIAGLSDTQCNVCHETKFGNFSSGHPAFSKTFPHRQRTAVLFDHVRHMNIHFEDAKVADKAPKSCAGCHQVDEARRRVAPAGFDKSCAACHGDQMAGREMVLLRLPEFEENLIDADDVLAACGPTADQVEALEERGEMLAAHIEALEADEEPEQAEEEEDDDEYEAVSVDEPDPLAAFLLGFDVDDMESYGEPLQTLIGEMAENGVDPLAERITDATDEARATAALAGLGAELVKRVACAWAANLEYEAPADPDFGGWYGEATEIRYKPLGHGDPVARAWIEFSIAAARAADDEGDEDARERAVAFRDTLLDRKSGVGACTKCHGINDRDADGAAAEGDGLDLEISWTLAPPQNRPYGKFNHAPHLNMLGRDFGCKQCHVMAEKADYAASFSDYNRNSFVSNFAAIKRETCAECHATGQVRQDCMLCHDYHLEPSFRKQMLAHDDES